MTVLAVDIGGTKLAAGIIEADGAPRDCRQVPTPVGGDAETVWAALAGLLDAVLPAAGAPVTGAGVGCGGPMTWPDGVVDPLNIPGWRGFPLRARLAGRFGLEVRLHNDAVCAAVGEHWRGAGRGIDDLLGMVVSTGVGGGLILGGRLVDGASGNAGHIGHLVVEPDGPVCGCGGRGCLEAVARGPAIVDWAVSRGWAGARSARMLAEAARAGDPVAVGAFQRAGELVGLGVAGAVALTDVRLVVIGGGVAQAGEVFFGPVRTSYRRHARVAHARRTEIVPAALGTRAGLVGAAALVLCGHRYWSPPARSRDH
ncbi:MAG TPA: ROK family protein [Mycobacteriales bacterium]|nr:ROK family protein [Mycobacteriales bacterium]